MSDKKQEIINNKPKNKQWDESRVIVLIIGLSLLIESGLIYYQAGATQIVVTGVTGISGLTLLLFAWLIPLEDDDDNLIIDDSKDIKELKDQEAISTIENKSEITESVSDTTNKTTTKPVSKDKVAIEDKKAEIIPKAEPEIELTWFQRLNKGLTKTRTGFVGKLKKLVLGKTTIDEDLMDDLEETLFEADMGVRTTQELLDILHKRVEEEEIKDPEIIYKLLKDVLKKKLTKYSSKPNIQEDGLTVFLIIGINGVGKTTTIAKLARNYIKQGKKVILAAGDTFRAAAIDQLTIWGERIGADVIRGEEGGDPGALVFDAIHAAKKRKADILLIDTAGRMHVKTNLMAELKKIQKIAANESNNGPHEILLVLDAITGQNAIQQAKQFNDAIPISGLVVTKLDGTAKGGVLFAVEEELNVPVKFIGVGEKMDDLMQFEPEQFLEALFSEDASKKKESDYKVL